MTNSPFIQIVNNLSVLIALSVISTFIIRHIEITSLKNKIIQGIIYSFAVIFIISNPLVLSKGLIFDGRSIVISISTLFFGPITGFCVFITAAIYRFLIGGPGAIMGLLVILSSFIIGLVGHYHFYKYKEKINHNIYFYLLQLIVHIVMVICMLGLPSELRKNTLSIIVPITILIYPIAGLFLATIIDTALEYESNIFKIKKITNEYSTTLNSIGEAVITLDLNGKITFANKAACQLLEKSFEELINKDYKDCLNFISNSTNEPVDLYKLVLKKREPLPLSNNTILVTDKKQFHIKETASPLIDNDKIVGIVIIFSDYSEQYELHNLLKENLDKYTAIFDNISDAILITDINGIILEVNNSFLNLNGYKREELIGYSAIEKQLYLDITDVQYMIQQVKFKREKVNQICKFKKANGDIYWGMQFATLINIRGQFYFLTVTKDITEIVNLENSLKENYENTRIMIDTVPDLIAITDIETGEILDVNQSIKNILNYEIDEVKKHTVLELNIWWNIEDRYKYFEILKQNGTVNNYKTNFRTKDNRKITVNLFSKFINYNNKKYVFTLAKDITELENLQIQLEKSEKKYKTLFYLNPNNILITRIDDGTIIEANDNLAKMFHTTKDELVGKNVLSDLKLWENEADRDKFIKEIINNGFVKDYHTTFILPNSEKFYGLISANLLELDGVKCIFSSTVDLTEQTLLQNKVLEQNKELEKINNVITSIINSTNSVMIYAIDLDLNIVNFSNSYKDFVYKKYTFELKPYDNLKDFIDNDRLKQVLERLENSKDKSTKYIDKDISDNKVKYYDTYYNPIFQDGKLIGYTILFIDITEKQELIDKLNESQIKYLGLLNNLPGFVFRCHFNPTYDMIYLSEKFNEITGYSIDDFITNRNSFDKIIVETNTTFEDLKTIFENKNFYEEVYKIITADGSYKWLYERSIPIRDENGNVIFLEGYIEDVTEKYELERKINEQNISLTNLNNELFKINKELLFAKEKAEESDRLKTAFLNNLNHEIRTPMNGIIGFSELLQKTDIDTNDRIYYATVINQSAYRLLSLVNQMIELSKIDTKQIEILYSDISLYHFAIEIVSKYKQKIVNKGLEFKFEYDDELKGQIIHSDEVKLSTAVSNLLDNALKFTTNGYIKLYFYKDNNSNLCISVEDTGTGLKPEELNRVFERFYQGSVEFNRGYEGSGLGLSLANEYIRLLNGNIKVTSEYGKGSNFTIIVPMDIQVENNDNVIKFKGKKFNYKIPENIPILVVDDDYFNNELLSDLLISMYNARIYKAYNGQQAIDILKNNFNILAVFMDVKMPVMDGLTATKEIRKFNKTIPIIGVSAYANLADIKNANEVGMDNYISKPYTKEQIDKVLTSFFK